MANFIVDVYYEGHSEIEVEASTKEDAIEKARERFVNEIDNPDFFDEVSIESAHFEIQE